MSYADEADALAAYLSGQEDFYQENDMNARAQEIYEHILMLDRRVGWTGGGAKELAEFYDKVERNQAGRIMLTPDGIHFIPTEKFAHPETWGE